MIIDLLVAYTVLAILIEVAGHLKRHLGNLESQDYSSVSSYLCHQFSQGRARKLFVWHPMCFLVAACIFVSHKHVVYHCTVQTYAVLANVEH